MSRVKHATSARDQLLSTTEALRVLLADNRFVALLYAERLTTLPTTLSKRLRGVEEQVQALPGPDRPRAGEA